MKEITTLEDLSKKYYAGVEDYLPKELVILHYSFNEKFVDNTYSNFSKDDLENYLEIFRLNLERNKLLLERYKELKEEDDVLYTNILDDIEFLTEESSLVKTILANRN